MRLSVCLFSFTAQNCRNMSKQLQWIPFDIYNTATAVHRWHCLFFSSLFLSNDKYTRRTHRQTCKTKRSEITQIQCHLTIWHLAEKHKAKKSLTYKQRVICTVCNRKLMGKVVYVWACVCVCVRGGKSGEEEDEMDRHSAILKYKTHQIFHCISLPLMEGAMVR